MDPLQTLRDMLNSYYSTEPASAWEHARNLGAWLEKDGSLPDLQKLSQFETRRMLFALLYLIANYTYVVD